jgi:hypothetical protein
MRNLANWFENFWCYTMHPAPMRPVRGQYRCPTCMKTYPVPWETGVGRFDRTSEESADQRVLRPLIGSAKRSAA